MKIPLQYVNDADGNLQAVQVSVEEWNKLAERIRHYEQLLKLRDDLTTAFSQAERMRKGKLRKPTLTEVLNAV